MDIKKHGATIKKRIRSVSKSAHLYLQFGSFPCVILVRINLSQIFVYFLNI
jgi:hypothetical protein